MHKTLTKNGKTSKLQTTKKNIARKNFIFMFFFFSAAATLCVLLPSDVFPIFFFSLCFFIRLWIRMKWRDFFLICLLLASQASIAAQTFKKQWNYLASSDAVKKGFVATTTTEMKKLFMGKSFPRWRNMAETQKHLVEVAGWNENRETIKRRDLWKIEHKTF